MNATTISGIAAIGALGCLQAWSCKNVVTLAMQAETPARDTTVHRLFGGAGVALGGLGAIAVTLHLHEMHMPHPSNGLVAATTGALLLGSAIGLVLPGLYDV